MTLLSWKPRCGSLVVVEEVYKLHELECEWLGIDEVEGFEVVFHFQWLVASVAEVEVTQELLVLALAVSHPKCHCKCLCTRRGVQPLVHDPVVVNCFGGRSPSPASLLASSEGS